MKNRRFVTAFAMFAVVLCVPGVVLAKYSLADYGMRIQILQTQWNHNGWGYHAFGRANLFDEHGTPVGVEFTYDCPYHLMASAKNEAYPAKWKKPNQSVEVVFGQIGAKPDSYHDCEFKIAPKQFVFVRRQNGLDTETAQEYQARDARLTPTTGPATSADVPVSANDH